MIILNDASKRYGTLNIKTLLLLNQSKSVINFDCHILISIHV